MHLVLGAGIAGISAAWHLKQSNSDVSCYEASSHPGGLVANFQVDGFRFDNAVHLSFTSDQYVRSIFDKTEYLKHTPEAYCIDRDFWLKHPVQNNLCPLPLDEKLAHIKSFIERPDTNPSNYGDWLDHQYGLSISNTYPKSYTKKYWGLDAVKLSTTWIGNRMRRADLDEVLGGALESRDQNDYYAKEMRYPKKGGYFQFVAPLVEEIDIKCEKRAVEIDVVEKHVLFEDGDQVAYETLISSLPLPVIVTLIKNCPADIRSIAQSLLWTTVDLISVGFDRADVPPHLWFYLYGDEHLSSRAYSPSLKSPNNAPIGKSSLQFEIYNLSTKEKLCPNALISNVRESLLAAGICLEEDILFLHHKHLPYGNVVFDHGMEERRGKVLQYLADVGIQSCGRFGEWDYLWSDQSFLSGKKAAEGIA